MVHCAYNVAFKILHVKIPGHVPLTTEDLYYLLQTSEHLQLTLDSYPGPVGKVEKRRGKRKFKLSYIKYLHSLSRSTLPNHTTISKYSHDSQGSA